MTIHELKTDPEVFAAFRAGEKMYEIRFNDRGYQVGDRLVLKETKFTGEEMRHGEPLIYTGRKDWMDVGYILRGPIYGLKKGWVILS